MKRQKLPLSALVLFGILGVAFLALAGGVYYSLTRVNTASRAEQALQKRLESTKREVGLDQNKYLESEGKYNAFKRTWDGINKRLGAGKTLGEPVGSNARALIEGLAKKHGLTITNYTPFYNQTRVYENSSVKLKGMVFQGDLLTADFQKLGKFLAELENSLPIYSMENLEITTLPNSNQLKCVVAAFIVEGAQ